MRQYTYCGVDKPQSNSEAILQLLIIMETNNEKNKKRQVNVRKVIPNTKTTVILMSIFFSLIPNHTAISTV